MRRLLIGAIAGLLALGATASAADYEHMMAMYTNRIPDMTAGSAGTAAIISPDGMRLLHLGSRDTCMLDLTETGSWEHTFCQEQDGMTRPRGPEDMFWSPDGEHLLMPTYAKAFQGFRDTDIELFDPDTFEITNLTDDHIEDSLLEPFTGTANFDVAQRWVDENTIAFLRYVIPEEGMTARSGPFLMTVDVNGGEPKQLSKSLLEGKGIVSTLAVAPGGQRFGYVVSTPEGVKGGGLYLIDGAGGAPQRIAAESDFARVPTGLAFSADGKFLLVVGPEDTNIDARAVDLESGTIIPVAAGERVIGVAWSPTEHAIAYIVWNGQDATVNPGGLFLSPAPGNPGNLLVAGDLMPPVCCGHQVFPWGANNMILLGRIEDSQTVLQVQLGP